MRTLPKSTIVIEIVKFEEDFTKRGREIMIGINFVRNDFTGKAARVGGCAATLQSSFSRDETVG